MKARLIERGADEKHTREIPITETELLIGRGADCDLRLPVPDVSRHHCILRITHDEPLIVDLGSSNGTYLNGERVRSQAALHSGDVLQVGECQFVVDLGDIGWADLGMDTTADPGAATVRRQPQTKEQKAEGRRQKAVSSRQKSGMSLIPDVCLLPSAFCLLFCKRRRAARRGKRAAQGAYRGRNQGRSAGREEAVVVLRRGAPGLG